MEETKTCFVRPKPAAAQKELGTRRGERLSLGNINELQGVRRRRSSQFGRHRGRKAVIAARNQC